LPRKETIMSSTRQTAFHSSLKTLRVTRRRAPGAGAAASPAFSVQHKWGIEMIDYQRGPDDRRARRIAHVRRGRLRQILFGAIVLAIACAVCFVGILLARGGCK
jgi:hypothetical protein